MDFRTLLRRVYLWVQLAFTGVFAFVDWGTPLRIPALAVFALTLILRAWLRVGVLDVTDDGIHFQGESGVIDRAREQIALVVPSGLGFFIFLRPWWRQPVLFVSGNESWLRPWFRAGVRVVGLSKARLALEDSGDKFFDRG